jgi:NRPS condensation-like uncharacterized protein
MPASYTDLGTAALCPLYHLMLGCRLTFSERLDADVLSRAVGLLLDVEPVLGCRFQERLVGGYWERCTDLDDAKAFDLVETDDSERDSADFHSQALDARGPRIAVRLLRSRETDDVCLKVDHVAGDGWSVKELACLLAETYTRVSADPDCIVEPNLTPRPTPANLWEFLTLEQRKAARQTPRLARPKWKASLRPGSGDELAVRRMTLSPERFRAVKAYGKARRATVTAMLVTSMVRALARTYAPPPGIVLPVSISADLRLFADDPRLMRVSNISSSNAIGIGYDPDDAFDEALGRVVESIRPWRDALWGARGLRRIPLPHRLLRARMAAAAAYFRRKEMLIPAMMNIGVLDEARLAFGDVVPVGAYILGAVPTFPGLAATVSTYRDTLTVWIGAYEQDTDPALLEQTLQGMDKELGLALADAGQ